MTITKEQIEQLIRIHNTLFNISTKGEDTLVMSDCLRAFQEVMQQIEKNNQVSSVAAAVGE